MLFHEPNAAAGVRDGNGAGAAGPGAPISPVFDDEEYADAGVAPPNSVYRRMESKGSGGSDPLFELMLITNQIYLVPNI